MAAKRSLIAALALAGIAACGTGTALAAPAQEPGPTDATILVSRFDDGSFEYPIARADAFTTYQAGQAIGPWTVTGGAVDLVDDGFWQAAEGNQSLDLNATVPGTVAQTFTTTPGQTYTVTYALAGNPGGGPALRTGRVLLDGQDIQDFSFDVTGKTYTDMGYIKRQATFVATTATTTLGFASTTANSAYGPVIDDVQVTTCSCPC
ncbi:choice-of-anchor C family protein [Streptomyces hoynatensis]|uniref:Choice-of-anchor C family protein n=1 Tax=Streptomyces hoynatensis TaxID=1141874 RepID=A0A3A9ZCJ1_9ACTN|nr:choice-of-anchor C family protein [Streptomyces hoynatensis]RKN45027.1 choice-of-anchor C family protein [Streptomyces hoynatensis]